MQQGQQLKAVQFFSLLHPITKRFSHIRKDEKFIVTSAIQNNQEFVIVSRVKSARIGLGFTMKVSDVENLFVKVD